VTLLVTEFHDVYYRINKNMEYFVEIELAGNLKYWKETGYIVTVIDLRS
jgi:hypothetical protein